MKQLLLFLLMCLYSCNKIRMPRINQASEVSTQAQLDKYLTDHGNKAVAGFCQRNSQACATVIPMAQVKATKTKLAFVKVDQTDSKDLIFSYKVSAIPTFVSFKDGQEVGRQTGSSKAVVDRAFKHLI